MNLKADVLKHRGFARHSIFSLSAPPPGNGSILRTRRLRPRRGPLDITANPRAPSSRWEGSCQRTPSMSPGPNMLIGSYDPSTKLVSQDR